MKRERTRESILPVQFEIVHKFFAFIFCVCVCFFSLDRMNEYCPNKLPHGLTQIIFFLTTFWRFSQRSDVNEFVYMYSSVLTAYILDMIIVWSVCAATVRTFIYAVCMEQWTESAVPISVCSVDAVDVCTSADIRNVRANDKIWGRFGKKTTWIFLDLNWNMKSTELFHGVQIDVYVATVSTDSVCELFFFVIEMPSISKQMYFNTLIHRNKMYWWTTEKNTFTNPQNHFQSIFYVIINNSMPLMCVLVLYFMSLYYIREKKTVLSLAWIHSI